MTNMTAPILALLSLFILLQGAQARGPFRTQFPEPVPMWSRTGHADPGKPLFLTPYIEKGDVETARKLAKVTLNGTNVESYSGFLTVDKDCNSNMFFWFIPALTEPEKAPVVLWLQGGPGGSSLFGMFVENGPWAVDKNINIYPRKFAWTNKYSMLYIDNPVGTGFSFTDKDEGYATNETMVAENLYQALVQFFALFPDLKKNKNEFYITGESYAGKYVPAVAHWIHKEPHPKKIFLRGIAVGDGFTDPPGMLSAYADFMFNTGLLDENQRDHFRNVTNTALDYIQQEKWVQALQQWNQAFSYFIASCGGLDEYNYLRSKIWDSLLNGDFSPGPSFFTNVTGSSNYYNYLRSKEPEEFNYYNTFVVSTEVRAAIHVGSLPYNSGEAVEKHLEADMMKSMKPWLAEIMNYYKVMLYTGQLDVIVALPLTEAMLQTTDWQYTDEYKRAQRSVWKVRPGDDEVAGYVRRVHDFYQVLVRAGGHILPYDQPERSFDMIDRFITGRPFA